MQKTEMASFFETFEPVGILNTEFKVSNRISEISCDDS